MNDIEGLALDTKMCSIIMTLHRKYRKDFCNDFNNLKFHNDHNILDGKIINDFNGGRG